MNILFRCDGSVEIGMGHVVRCLALADHLRENQDCNIHFAMRQSELGISKVRGKYPVLQSDEESFDYENWLVKCIYKTKAEILIMDMRDGLTRQALKQLKKKTSIKVVSIDDPEDKRLEADLALYPPVPQLEKVSWDGFKGELYTGWEFVILRKEFLCKYPKPNNSIPKILVSMGGTDKNNITQFVIDTLDLIDEQFFVTIILGLGYKFREKLSIRLSKVNYKYKIFSNPENIANVMSQSDLGVISFGQTAYELAALKIPAIYLCLSDDHVESSILFMNEGIGVSMGLYIKEGKQDLAESILFHVTEKYKVKEMSDRAGLLNISNLYKISSFIKG